MNRTSRTLLLSSLLLASCASTHREIHTTGRPLGELQSRYDYLADVTLESEPVTGDSQGGCILWLFDYGDSDYAETIVYSGSRFTFLTDLLGNSRLDELKQAAVRDACAASGCDVLAYPMFRWKKFRHLFYVEYLVEVTGYPGHIRGIENVPRTIIPGTLRLGPDDRPIPSENIYRFEGLEGGPAPILQIGG